VGFACGGAVIGGASCGRGAAAPTLGRSAPPESRWGRCGAVVGRGSIWRTEQRLTIPTRRSGAARSDALRSESAERRRRCANELLRRFQDAADPGDAARWPAVLRLYEPKGKARIERTEQPLNCLTRRSGAARSDALRSGSAERRRRRLNECSAAFKLQQALKIRRTCWIRPDSANRTAPARPPRRSGAARSGALRSGSAERRRRCLNALLRRLSRWRPLVQNGS